MVDRDRSPVRTDTPCQVCNIEARKYTCPHCRITYCSAACFKVHRADSNCSAVKTKRLVSIPSTTEALKPKVEDLEVEDGDRVPPDKLGLLDKSKDVVQALQNPHLRQMILSLDKAKNPADAVHKAMLEPIFVEFVDACLQTVEPGNPTVWPLGS